MSALILMPSAANPGFLEVFISLSLEDNFCGDEDEFLDTLESYESEGYTIWLTEGVK